MRSGSAAPPAPGHHARVLEREPAGHEPELAEPVELPRGLRRHPRERVEVVDLRGHLRAERARVEPVDARDRRPAAPKARPERVDAGPGGRDDPDAGDPDAPTDSRHRGIAGGAAAASRSATGAVATASAIALNVASVRPAMGRVNQRSTTLARPGSRGRELVLDPDVAPGRPSARCARSRPCHASLRPRGRTEGAGPRAPPRSATARRRAGRYRGSGRTVAGR